MFGIGITEIVVILVVALLVVGPKKLPELAKTLGRTMAEFRRTADDFKESIYKDESTIEADREKAEEQRKTSKIMYPVDPPDHENGNKDDLVSDKESKNIVTENPDESCKEVSES